MRLALLILMVFSLALPVRAQEATGAYAAQADIPLVVIRFNQPRIHYEKQLYNALQRAVDIKPALLIQLVSYVPQGNDRSSNQRAEKQANAEVAQVMRSLNTMGVPQSRVGVQREQTSAIRYHEIHLYVR